MAKGTRFIIADKFNRSRLPGYFLWFHQAEEYVTKKCYEKYKIIVTDDNGVFIECCVNKYETAKEEGELFSLPVIRYDHKKIIEYINTCIDFFDIEFTVHDYFPETGYIIYRFKTNEDKQRFRGNISERSKNIEIINNVQYPELFVRERDRNRFIKIKKIKIEDQELNPLESDGDYIEE